MKLATRTGLAALGASALAVVLLANVVSERFEVVLRDRVDEILEVRAGSSAAILVAVGDRIAVSELNGVLDSARVLLDPDSSEPLTIEVGRQPPGELPPIESIGFRTVSVADEGWRLLAVPVADVPAVGDRAIVEFAEPLGPVQERIREVRRRVLAAGFVAAFGAGALGWLAGRRAARPLTRLQQDAAGLGAVDGSPLTVADTYGTPEVDDLAAALNTSLSQLGDANERREAALAAARDFAASATHELRTPLQGAMTHLDVALVSEPSSESVAAARTELGRMASSLAAVQALSQADLARLEWFEPMDLAAIGDLVDEVTSRSAVELVVDAADPGSGPSAVWPDGVRLAVDNVVRNAITHGRAADGPPGRVEVRVAIEGGAPVITVDDDGPGVPAQDRARVLAPFERGATSTPGSGLGLAVASRVARAHGGAVSIGASSAGGARVRIELGPVSRAAG
ncbi:MAG TPA: HAMP domain-containing sensor histidine kinase [Ilumatobacteraceae bacterium]|nr:HAMP domain-containing sensor histidine kinase [Ilumatobacteraceae bacterium]